MGDVKIQTSRIPHWDLDNLAEAIAPAIRKFYEDPKNRAAFEAWHAKWLAEHPEEATTEDEGKEEPWKR